MIGCRVTIEDFQTEVVFGKTRAIIRLNRYGLTAEVFTHTSPVQHCVGRAEITENDTDEFLEANQGLWLAETEHSRKQSRERVDRCTSYQDNPTGPAETSL